MSRFRMLRIAAISWLPVFAMVAGAYGAQPYNVATDWAATYPTTNSVGALTSATWGPTGAADKGWSSGVFSWNWTNSTAVTFNPANNNVQYLATYYNPSTGYETSGSATNQVATFTYTVPFQAYQLNPGQTIHVATSPVVSVMSNSGNISETGQAVKLPTNWTATNTTTSGSVQEIGKAEGIGFIATEYGFRTTASGTMKDGGGTVQDQLAGAFTTTAPPTRSVRASRRRTVLPAPWTT